MSTLAMAPAARATRVARLLAALLLALVALAPAAGVASAAGLSFGDPTADAKYGEGITFTVPFTASTSPQRVELRLTYPDSLGPVIIEVPAAAAGATQTLRYTLDLTGGAHLVPNTPIKARWAAIPSGGGEPVLSRNVAVRYRDTSQDWKTLKGDIVVVHWYDGSEAFGQRALAIGDKAVKDTSALLGVTETEPIDFFIYGDDASFRTALGPGTRENVGGQAHADIRTMFALIEPAQIDDTWVGIVVPHELTHLVFDTAVHNPYRFPPRWVNEGLAVYLSEGYGARDRNAVADAVDHRDLIPLTALTGQFPTDPEKTSLAYSLSVSAIDYLVRTYDQDALLGLIGAYKEGLTDDEAFTKALGKDVAAFQAGWLAELGAEAPAPYGPVANPAGPMPPGWDSPAQGAPSAAPGSTPAAASGSPSGTQPAEAPASASASPAPGGAASGSGSNGVLLLVVVVGVVVVVIAGLFIARRRTTPA